MKTNTVLFSDCKTLVLCIHRSFQCSLLDEQDSKVLPLLWLTEHNPVAVSHQSSFALEGLALRENININNNSTFCDELAAEQDFGLLIAGSQVSV